MSCIERIQREYSNLLKNPIDRISAGPKSDDNLKEWSAILAGPPGTPYEEGTFQLDITFPDEYPFKPPMVRFATRIYHCNISPRSGAICLDILKTEWSPALTISKVLLSISSLLDDPEPLDPLAPEIANKYTSDRAGHDATAREWTLAYAT